MFSAGGSLSDCLCDHGNLDHTSEEQKSKLKQVIELGAMLACSGKRGEEEMSLLSGGGKSH